MSSTLVSGDRRTPWLDRLPKGTAIKPLKHVAFINARTLRESTPADFEIRYVDIGNVTNQGEIKAVETMPFGQAPSRARRIVRNGDILVSTVRTYLRAIAAAPHDDQRLVASTGFAVVTPMTEVVLPEYLRHWCQSDPFVEEVCARSVGVSYPATNASEVGAIPVPLPSGAKQRAIAEFLDRKTAAIDALIEKKERLIALLAEKRAALIDQAVTKGLDPTVPMKPSGIPWIGDIPEHWHTRKLRYIAGKLQGRLIVQPHLYFEEDGVTIVFGYNIKDGRIDEAALSKVSFEIDSRHSHARARGGDLFTVRLGNPGMTAIVPPSLDGCHFASIMWIHQHPRFHSEWLWHAMNSPILQAQIQEANYGATLGQFNIADAVDWTLPFPPLVEQVRIAAELSERLTASFDVERKVRRQVEKIFEYRQALITAAVTGQLEIPEAAA